MIRITLTEIAVLGGIAYLVIRARKSDGIVAGAKNAVAATVQAGSDVLDTSQLFVTDKIASITGLDSYQNALLAAESKAEIDRIQADWKALPWYRRF